MTKQKIVGIIVLILFVFGLLQFDDFSTVRYSSFLFLTFSVFILFFSKSFNRVLLNFGLSVILLMVIHSVINYQTVDWKILLNFNVLLVSTLSIVNYLLSKGAFGNAKYGKLIIYITYLLFVILMISTWGLRTSSLNHQYAKIYELTSMPKQMLGVLAGWFLCYVLAYEIKRRKIWTAIVYFSILGFMILSLLGIRSFILGFIGILIFFALSRKALNFMVITAIIFFVPLVYFTDFEVPTAFLFDIRGVMLDASLNIARSSPIGIGIGGYDEYLTNIYRLNTGDYSSTGLEYRYIKSAVDVNVLESDLLVWMVSFGAAITVLIYYLWIKWLGFLKYSNKITSFNRFVYFINVYYLFSGFTQDHFLTFHWWVLILLNLYYYFKVGLGEKDSNCQSARWTR